MKKLIFILFVFIFFTGNSQPPAMRLLFDSANPQFVSTGGIGTTSGTTLNIPYPATQNNDMLIMHVAQRSRGSFTTPSGWTAFGADPGEDPQLLAHAWYYKRADGTETGNQAFTIAASTQAAGIIYNYRSVNTGGTFYHSALTGNVTGALSTVLGATSTAATDLAVVLWMVETTSTSATSSGTGWVADSELTDATNGGWRFEAHSYKFSSITTSSNITLSPQESSDHAAARVILKAK